MKCLLFAERIQRKIERMSCYAAAGIVFIMMFPISVDVILRYLFNAPLPEIYQLTEFMMVGVVYLAIAYVQSIREHVQIEMATAWLPKKIQDALDIFGYVVGLGIFLIITWQSSRLAWEAWIIKDFTLGIIELPLWPARSILPIGTGLLCLRLILDILNGVVRLLRSSPGNEDQKVRNI